MLHEVLFALSGHSSPLLSDDSDEHLPHVSPAERALLKQLTRTAKLLKAVRSHVSKIASDHPSTICRAVANSIIYTYLPRFQESVLDFERQVLTKDSSTVGAYNIVPLSAVVTHFRGWDRPLEWLWNLLCFMLPPDRKVTGEADTQDLCSGVNLMSRLRESTKTGYPDIEDIAQKLTSVAEKSWIRHLSNWLLLARPPPQARHDFFIRERDEQLGNATKYIIDISMIPPFVATEIASSILFMGTILQQSVDSGSASIGLESLSLLPSRTKDSAFHPNELKTLATLQNPISTAAFSAELSSLRQILSDRLVNQVLPSSQLIRMLRYLSVFLLGGSYDFTDTIIQESDKHLLARHAQLSGGSRNHVPHDITSVMLKDGDLQSVLAKTWTAIAPSVSKGQALDEGLEWAREHLRLEFAAPTSANVATDLDNLEPIIASIGNIVDNRFSSFLLSTPILLSPKLEKPFNLVITASDLLAYSTISSYLMAIRRAHVHLTGLWKQDSFRKTPASRNNSSRSIGRNSSFARAQALSANRASYMRSIWVCCSKCVVLLSELGDYFTAETISNAWSTFHNWARSSMSDGSRPSTADSTRKHNGRPTSQSSAISALNSSIMQESTQSKLLDPELLANAHRQYLSALAEDLLLTNTPFNKLLASFLVHVDQLVALIGRLQAVQQKLDLQEEGVIENFSANLTQDEADVKQQLSRARDALGEDLRSIIEVLKTIEITGTASRTSHGVRDGTNGAFKPWRSAGVDHLLMRLDAGIVNDDRAGD